MNSALGFGFIALGLAASVLGTAGGVYALASGRRLLLATVHRWVWLVVVASVGAFVIMEIALARVLHVLGVDHTRLTYNHNSRDDRLTDVYGDVITQALA